MSFSDIIYTLAVPWNLPGQDPLGYKRKYSCCNNSLYEKLKTKYMKINTDIKYIKTCKKKELTPRSAKVNLAIKRLSNK